MPYLKHLSLRYVSYLPTYLDVPCFWHYRACLPAFFVFLSKKDPLHGYPASLTHIDRYLIALLLVK
jgi:hypothetical protein